MTTQERATRRAEGKPMFDMPIESYCQMCGRLIARSHLMSTPEEQATVKALGASHRKSDCRMSNN